MWWPDQRVAFGLLARWAAVLAVTAGVGGCFQPLYGEQPIAAGPGLRAALSAIAVEQIDEGQGRDRPRLVIFGGAYPLPPTYLLTITMSSTLADIIFETTTTRPAIEDYGINATYTLIEIASGKPAVTGQTFARVSYDIPGQEQRFARIRGLRDAETRAAKVIADNIRARLAAYFTAGT
jgi:LPS-assembly lipoprotein